MGAKRTCSFDIPSQKSSNQNEKKPLQLLAVQGLPRTGSSWHVVSLSKVVCLFRGSAMKQGAVTCLNGVSLQADRVYVRTAGCHTLPGGVYVTEFRSVKQASWVLPPSQFFYLNPNTLLNQDFLLGANVLEIRGTIRMIAIQDERSLLPVRLLVTSGFIREVKKRIGLPVRQGRRQINKEAMVNPIRREVK
ncbi:MAG: hypothetical protein AB7F90_09080 [Nitrospirales bacterium]